jgi:phosphomannomutase
MTETPLTFGTAGLRGPMRDGPGGMNVDTVTRATWAVAKVLKDRCLGGSTVVVGRDARHQSDDFAMAAAEVLVAEGFSVVLLPDATPTPVVAFAVRHMRAAAGVQITASHNPPRDNGYKVYFDGGLQIVPPTDRDIESAMAAAPATIDRAPVSPSSTEIVEQYIARAASVRRTTEDVRVALTPMHGVGGEVAVQALREAGITDVHVVEEQFAPDPDFPTVDFPNPEEPGATDLLLSLAAYSDADVAIALDPDADRCAMGVPTVEGWRMLTGDETGWLLGDYILTQLDSDVADSTVVASTIVSSRMLAAIAASHGAEHVETLTGFKWLARADAGRPGATLVYAYEEAIGHCVDPSAVRDKDGISAAVLVCDLVAALRREGRTVSDALDDLARKYGLHMTTAVSVEIDADAVMSALRADPPTRVADEDVAVVDLLDRRGQERTDALIYTGETIRLAVRPSGTEPKVKAYLEIRMPVQEDVESVREFAEGRLEDAKAAAVDLLQRGPN